MAAEDQFRQALEDLDVPLLRRMWSEVAPHLPQPKSDAEALIAAHNARTQAISVSFTKRAYSHRWLTERSYPSGLPDALRDKAERMYPVVVEAVAIAVRSRSGPARAKLIETAMSDAVAEAYADGITDQDFIRARMKEAREKITRQIT